MPQTVAHFDVPEKHPDWRVRGARSKVVQIATAEGGQERALHLTTSRAMTVSIPGEFEPASFNRVVVVLEVQHRAELELRLVRDSEIVHTAHSEMFVGEDEVLTIPFEFDDLAGETEPFDELVLNFLRARGSISLISVALLKTPAASWLPDPALPPQLIEIGTERRRGVGLLAGHPVETEGTAGPGSTLRFSYGTPPPLHNVRDPELVVQLLDAPGGLVREEILTLDAAGSEPSWHETTIELPVGDFRARFEYRASATTDAACALGEPAIVRTRPDARTVLLVTSDTHRADHVGAAHSSVTIATPNLDALAARGLFFEDCVSSINLTVPSHAALMTGVHPRDSGLVDNVSMLSDQAPTLAERFREAGYATFAAVSVQHLEQGGVDQGFDRLSGPFEFQRDSAETMERLCAWIDEADGVPLFLWLHSFDAHDPYEVPEAYRRLYYAADRNPYARNLPRIDEALLPSWDMRVRDLDYIAAQYASEVTYLDEKLGKLLEHPRIRDAVVAVTADHGEFLIGRRHFDHFGIHPSTISIPLILAWPGAPQGRRIKTPVRQIDLGRTLLDLAGLETAEFPGHDLTGELVNAPRFGVAGNAKAASVYADGWFLWLSLKNPVFDEGRPPTPAHKVGLYHVADDPDCRNDLSEEQPELTRKLRAALVEWLVQPRRAWSITNRTQDAAMLAELAQLGYATDLSEDEDAVWFDPTCTCEWCAKFQ